MLIICKVDGSKMALPDVIIFPALRANCDCLGEKVGKKFSIRGARGGKSFVFMWVRSLLISCSCCKPSQEVMAARPALSQFYSLEIRILANFM